MMPATLSVILITRNEAANIRDCLASVSWADELIVVDSGSTDETLALAREFTDRVFSHDWPGFGPQKNRALGYATSDWVLSLDADERVTPELRQDIEAAIGEGRCDGYRMPRLSQFCGKFVRHSGWYPDPVLRLFKRTQGRFSDSLVHERVKLPGKVGMLGHPLLHYSYLSRQDVERKVEHYSSAAAQQMFQSGRSVWPMMSLLRGAWAFLRTYLFKLGVLDGWTGWQIAAMNARTTYLKYHKLARLRSGQTPA
jgi:glycosyltransferase involved in cell wall biosynthesis